MVDEGRFPNSAKPGGVTVVLGQAIELPPYRQAIDEGHRPRHVLLDLAERTGGAAISSSGIRPNLADRLISIVVGGPHQVAVARRALRASAGGFIHANGEQIGFSLLLLQRLGRRRSARIGFWVMSPNGPRVRFWLQTIRRLRLQPLMLAESEVKAAAIRRLAGPDARVAVLGTPVDSEFFSPGPTLHPKGPPLIASAGLERRDYRTLAAAIEGLDAEVQICAVSPDARTASASMPEPVPANMTFVDLSIEELRDLYRRADLVVIPTLANDIDAGGSTAVEAKACGCPVVTSGQGMFLTWAEQGLIRVAETGSADDLRRVLNELLADPGAAAELRRRARQQTVTSQTDRQWMSNLIEQIRQGGVAVADEGHRAGPQELAS